MDLLRAGSFIQGVTDQSISRFLLRSECCQVAKGAKFQIVEGIISLEPKTLGDPDVTCCRWTRMFGISIGWLMQLHLTAEPCLSLKRLYLCVVCHALNIHTEWLFSDTCCHIVSERRFPFAAVLEMWVRRLMCHYERWMTVINSCFLQRRMRHDTTLKCQPEYGTVSLNKTCICSINYLCVSNQNLCLRMRSGSVF